MKKLAIFLACVLLFAATATGCQSSDGSKGLEFVLSDDGSYYIVNSIGKCKDTKVIIPSVYKNKPVKSIGRMAFKDCIGLTSIAIPDSVTSIGNFAFHGCTGLTSITIPNSVTSIGLAAFSDCTSLQSITIPDSVTSIVPQTFEYCKSLTSITIPDSVTSISKMAFRGCSSLTSITIPNSVKSIGDYTFLNCDNLKDVYYTGTEEEWNAITIIGSHNFPLTKDKIHYNSKN